MHVDCCGTFYFFDVALDGMAFEQRDYHMEYIMHLE